MSLEERDEAFRLAVGTFIVTFSELEHGLGELAVFTIDDLRELDDQYGRHIGLRMDQKINAVNDCIEKYHPELKDTWFSIKQEIDELNSERRHLTHGIAMYHVPNPTITSKVRRRNSTLSKEWSIEDIKDLSNRLIPLIQGEGVCGDFHTAFVKARIDRWNNFVVPEYRIVYSVNSEILSNWKGT